MFKKSSNSPQLDFFTSPKSLLSGKSLSLYEDDTAWHNQFRDQVTMRIDESIFSPLYCKDNGTPNAPVRILIAMMILKEAERLSDQKLFENCRFNMLTRSAIGLVNASDALPTESTYYLFRKRVHDYAKTGNKNLFDAVFAQITKEQCVDFEVSGKRIRMDSKLMGSNIAWLSRYEIIHETLRLFYKQVKRSEKFTGIIKERLDQQLSMEGNKVVYTSSNEEIKTRIQELGELIYSVLPLFSSSYTPQYQTLQRVFNEQYKVDANKIVVGREKEEISAKSVQSPHDTDCHYRNKDGNKVKGYGINITESCDDGLGLNLIGHVDVRNVSTSDLEFFQDDIEKSQKVFTDKIEAVHADGAYHSVDNQIFCKENGVQLYLHAIQGAKGRYQFNVLENGEVSVFDTVTDEIIDSIKKTYKNGIVKWRIPTKTNYRYFTQKEIDTYLIRKSIDETPIEILQKRNNVEATVFQLCYHYSNAKSRYRGEVKHQMWADVRCLWVNFVRILNYIRKKLLHHSYLVFYAFLLLNDRLHFLRKTLLSAILPDLIINRRNFEFSFS